MVPGDPNEHVLAEHTANLIFYRGPNAANRPPGQTPLYQLSAVTSLWGERGRHVKRPHGASKKGGLHLTRGPSPLIHGKQRFEHMRKTIPRTCRNGMLAHLDQQRWVGEQALDARAESGSIALIEQQAVHAGIDEVNMTLHGT